MPQILKILLPIALGALIGYLTNDLAIRMLFRPRRAVMIGKFRLPFTPGIIPKNQKRIAKAVGDAVGSQLVTSGDLVDRLKRGAAKSEIAKTVTDAVFDGSFTLRSLAQSADLGSLLRLPAPKEDPAAENQPAALPILCETDVPDFPEASEEPDFPEAPDAEDAAEQDGESAPEDAEETAEEATGFSVRVGDYVAERVIAQLDGMDLRTPLDDLIWEAVKDYRKNPLIALFLNESTLDAVVDKAEAALRKTIDEQGRDAVRAVVTEQAHELASKPLSALAGEFGFGREQIEDAVSRALDRCVEEFGAVVSEKTDISGIVRQKIEEMDTEELEKLIMSVMKRELRAIVNLGALLGALIGALNLLINAL
ncbi:MAG: DUF445 family protein [Clostridia bacterium]|nr:DUF445 family protein [Clostridia bacterium]